MVSFFWRKVFPVFTHPAIWQALFLSYWSRAHLGWVLASWTLLVGVSGGLYYLSLYAPAYLDILLIFGKTRRFLIFWQVLALFGLRAATAEPLIAYWLNFFLWHTGVAWLLHWRWRFSLHAQGWAALATFFLWYGKSYALMAFLCLSLWGLVAYQRWHSKAHSTPEIAFGSMVGAVITIGYVLAG